MMINHARTLLLNVSGNVRANASYPGEEYVPARFTAQALPIELQRIRNVLFGPNPDRVMLNYRLRQLLTLVHSSELGDYLTALDSRVTYWPTRHPDLFNASSFGSIVSLLEGSNTWSLSLVGNPAQTVNSSQLYNQWSVKILDASNLQLVHLLVDHEIFEVGYSINENISNPVPLPSSSLQIVVTPGLQGVNNWPSWKLETLARPLLNLSDIYLALQQGVDQDVENLMSANSEPYLTCRKLWGLPKGPIAYKLGALTVALIYKLDAFYRNQ